MLTININKKCSPFFLTKFVEIFFISIRQKCGMEVKFKKTSNSRIRVSSDGDSSGG